MPFRPRSHVPVRSSAPHLSLSRQARVVRLESALGEAVASWHFAPLVRGLQALRGIKLVSAATLVAEVGDLTRFDNPKQLMAYVGLR